MGLNRAKDYVTIIPEDPIYWEYAKGFHRGLPQRLQGRFEVLEPFPGGVNACLENVKALAKGNHNSHRHFLGLIDFDSKSAPTGDLSQDRALIENRILAAEAVCAVSPSVFILGPFMEAEDLKRELVPLSKDILLPRPDEEVVNIYYGRLFASENLKCTSAVWGCVQLQHEFLKAQVKRLCEFMATSIVAV